MDGKSPDFLSKMEGQHPADAAHAGTLNLRVVGSFPTRLINSNVVIPNERNLELN